MEEEVLTFSFYAAGLAADSEAATSSHIEEMIQELTQQEGVEAAAEMPQERAIIKVGEASTLQDLPKDLPSSDSRLGKEILTL